MEEIEQKLNSENVFLQSQAITSLSQIILTKSEKQNVYDTDEVKLLWKIANTGSAGVSTLAVEVLVQLVQQGYIPAPATIQNFIADLISSKTPASLIRGVTEVFLLLCEAETKEGDVLISPFKSHQTHPYVLITRRCPELTQGVIEEIHYLLTHPNSKVQNSWSLLLEPYLYFCFCLSELTPPVAIHTLKLLISSHNVLGKSLILLFCKLIMFIKVECQSHFNRKLLLLCGLAHIALSTKNQYLSAPLLPCLIMCLPHIMKYGLPTRTVERNIAALARQLGQGCDITICALAEALPHTTGQLQVTLLRVGATLLSHKDGNPLIGGRLLPSLLQILSAPCSAITELSNAASTLVSLIQALPSHVSTNAQLAGNEFWEMLSLSFPDLATYIPAVDLCNQIIRDPSFTAEWLTKLASTVNQISKFHYTIVSAVFLYHQSTPESVREAAKVLEREVVKCKSLSLELFPIVLYRLGREPDPTTRLQLLYLITSMAVHKLCVAMVLKTLLALWSSQPLKPLILRLMLEVWKTEPRIYSHLSKLIRDKSITTQDLEISRAYVVAEICKTKPQHGEELLSILSGFLNECRNKDGTPQAMLAFDGIYELCATRVIDLRTTWKVIAPNLVRDKRPEVIVKLCRLLSLTTTLQIKSEEYEVFSVNSASILWAWAASKLKNSVNEAAFKALEKFDPHHFKLKMLPSYAREGHKLPPKMASTPFEAARKAEDVLTYVPGLAWVKLAIGCPKPCTQYVESFLKALVEKELVALPKGIYLTAIQEAKRKGCRSSGGQPEPPSYSFLSETSFLKAAVVFLQDFSKLLEEATKNDPEEVEKLLQCTHIILLSLGQALNRPFPALDWSFLNEVHAAVQKWDHWFPKIRHGIFRVTAQQCNKSASALNVISRWISPSSSILTRQDQESLFHLLDQLGRGLNPQLLQKFLTHVFTEAVTDDKHLATLLYALQPHLTCDYVHETNRNVMSNLVESLTDKMDPTNNSVYDAYKTCVADLPQSHIERLTSPSLWWEITDEKLYRAAVLRCYVATRDPEATALPWLNDLIDSAAGLPGDRSHFLLVMAETLTARSEAEESSCWLLSLLGRLRDQLKRAPCDNLVLVHEQQQKITFYFDMLVICLVIWSGMWAACPLPKLTSSYQIRNNFLAASLISLQGRPDWSHALPQLLTWFVSYFALLQPYLATRYHLTPPILLLASLSTKLSQSMWNKVVTQMI